MSAPSEHHNDYKNNPYAATLAISPQGSSNGDVSVCVSSVRIKHLLGRDCSMYCYHSGQNHPLSDHPLEVCTMDNRQHTNEAAKIRPYVPRNPVESSVTASGQISLPILIVPKLGFCHRVRLTTLSRVPSSVEFQIRRRTDCPLFCLAQNMGCADGSVYTDGVASMLHVVLNESVCHSLARSGAFPPSLSGLSTNGGDFGMDVNPSTDISFLVDRVLQ